MSARCSRAAIAGYLPEPATLGDALVRTPQSEFRNWIILGEDREVEA